MADEVKKVFSALLIAAVVLGGAFLMRALLCRDAAVCDNGAGPGAIGAELDSAVRAERETQAGIADAAEQIGDAGREATAIGAELEAAAGEERTDRELLAECQRIIAAVRARTEKDAQPP